MAEISKIKIGSTQYDIKDAVARAAAVGGVHYIGITTTALTDKATTSPVTIGDAQVAPKSGDIVIYVSGDKHLEFIWNASATPAHWDEFGSTGELGTAAFMDYEDVNLEHTHTINNIDTTAIVEFGAGAKTESVVTNVVLDTIADASQSTGKIQYVKDVSSAGSIIFNPKIIVPDVGTGKYTPEGGVTLGYKDDAITTGGTVSYGDTDSEKILTANVTGGSVSITQGTISGSTVGVGASLDAAPAFTGKQATITPTKTSESITVAGEVLTIPASVITTVGSATYTPEGSNSKPTITVAQGTVSGSTVGVSATHTNPTVKVTLPELSFTNPKYSKTTTATFAGTEKDVSVACGYNKYNLYAYQDNSTQYNGTAAQLRANTGFDRELGYMYITPTKGQANITGLSGTVTYKKADTISNGLAKTVKVLKTKA